MKEAAYHEDLSQASWPELEQPSSCINISATPDYMWLPSANFYKANKIKHDDYVKALKEITALDEELQEKFWNHLKNYLKSELKRKEPHDLRWSKDTKMSEILGDFKNDTLNELTDPCLRHHLMILVHMMWHIWGHFDYIINSDMSKKNSICEIQLNFKKDRYNIPLQLKYKLLNREIETFAVSNLTSDMKTVHLNRTLANENKAKDMTDDEGKWSCYGNVCKEMTK